MNTVLTAAVVVLVVVTIAALFASQHGPLARLIAALLRIPATVVATVRDVVDGVSNWLVFATRYVLRRVTPTDSPTWVGYVVLATTLATACTLVVAFTELVLLDLTYPLLGFGFETGTVSANLTMLVAASTAAMTIVWALVCAEVTDMAAYTELAAKARTRPVVRYGYFILLAGATMGIAYLLYQLAIVRSFEADVASSSLTALQAGDPFALDAPVPATSADAPGAITAAEASAGKRHAHIVLMAVAALTVFVGKWYALPAFASAGTLLLVVLWLVLAPLRLVVHVIDRMLAVVTDELAPAFLDLTYHVADDTKNFLSAHLSASTGNPELDALVREGDRIADALGERVAAAVAGNGYVHEAVDLPAGPTRGEPHG